MSSGFNFGASKTPTTFSQQSAPFGNTQPLNLSSTTAPAFSQVSGGFNFTSPQTTSTAAPAFGTTALNFNAPTSAPQLSAFGSITSTTSSLPSFGTTLGNQAPTSNLFGTQTPSSGFGGSLAPAASTAATLNFPNTTKTTPSFGGLTSSAFGSVPATSATTAGYPLGIPTTGLGLGTINSGLTMGTPNTLAPTTNLLSNPLTSTSLGGLNFSTNLGGTTTLTSNSGPTTASSTPLSFAMPSTGASTLFNSGTTTSSTLLPSLSLSTSSTAPTGNFGTTTSSAAPTMGLNFTTPKTTASLSFNLGTSTASTGSALPSFALSTSITTTSAGPSLGLNLPKPPSLTTAAQPSTTAQSDGISSGLGGISSTPPKLPTTTAVETVPKDQPLPNELFQSVESFKKFLQEQKSYLSEIARFSTRDLKKVETDIDSINKKIGELENELRRNQLAAEKLKVRTSNALKHAEMAQRTFETPAGLQYDNTTPLSYFIELTDDFERQMQFLKIAIDDIDKSVTNTKNRSALTSQDLALGMRHLHETFVSLAGRLQSLHTQVEAQKEQYLELRKVVLKDYTNVFETRSKNLDSLEAVLENITSQASNNILTGPTPFNSLGSSHAQTLAQIPVNPPPAYPGAPGSATPGVNPGLGKPSHMLLFGSGFGNTSALNFNSSANSSMFQLQKPPVGNKRGKS